MHFIRHKLAAYMAFINCEPSDQLGEFIKIEKSVHLNLAILTRVAFYSARNHRRQLLYLSQCALYGLIVLLQAIDVCLNSTDFDSMFERGLFIPTFIIVINKNVLFGAKSAQIRTLLVDAFADPLFQPRSVQQRRVALGFVRAMVRLFAALFLAYFLLFFGWLFVSPLSFARRRMIFDMWVPFAADSDGWYACGVALQVVYFVNLIGVNCCTDCALWTFITFIGLECRLVADTLRNIHAIAAENGGRLEKEKEKILKSAIKQHQHVLKFAKNLMATFHSALLCFFSVSVVVISVALYQINKDVIVQSEDLYAAVFETRWLGASRRFKQDLRFFALNLRNPIVLKVGKLFPISYVTFSQMMRASWNYFMMIRSTSAN